MTKTRKQTRTRSSGEDVVSSVPILDVPLSPHWAFVVQFRAIPGGSVFAAGRVEHLVSGHTRHFQSLEELHAYLGRELQAADSKTKS